MEAHKPEHDPPPADDASLEASDARLYPQTIRGAKQKENAKRELGLLPSMHSLVRERRWLAAVWTIKREGRGKGQRGEFLFNSRVKAIYVFIVKEVERKERRLLNEAGRVDGGGIAFTAGQRVRVFG